MKNVEEKTLTEVIDNYIFWKKMASISEAMTFIIPAIAFFATMFFF